jgi:hypothetical protein
MARKVGHQHAAVSCEGWGHVLPGHVRIVHPMEEDQRSRLVRRSELRPMKHHVLDGPRPMHHVGPCGGRRTTAAPDTGARRCGARGPD